MSKKRKKNSFNPQWSNIITLPNLGTAVTEGVEAAILADEERKEIEYINAAIDKETAKILSLLKNNVSLLAYTPDHKFTANTLLDYAAQPSMHLMSGNVKYSRLSILEAVKEHYKRLINGDVPIWEAYLHPMGWSQGAYEASLQLPPLTADQTETLFELQSPTKYNCPYDLMDIMTSLYPELQ